MYDEVSYNRTKLNTSGTNHETVDYMHRTINRDLDVPTTTNSSYAVPTISYSNASEGKYDCVLPVEFIQHLGLHDTIKMDTNSSYGVSTVEGRATAFSTTVKDSNTKAHQSSQQNDSAQMHHNTATTTTGDVKEDNVQLHTNLDQRHGTKMNHSHLFANTTKLSDQSNYGVINQPRCDDPSFDTIVDQKPTDSKSIDEITYGVINQPQCNDSSFDTIEPCLPLIANSKLTEYGVINQPRCDDPGFDMTVDRNSITKSCLPVTPNDARSTDECKYGVINQPQCDDHM